MKSIYEDIENEYIVNKSKFITKLIRINDISDIDIKLNDIKNMYKDATHYCYAYIIDNFKKCSDDKEPSGTAGLPILNVLENNNLNHILCVVIRYFGGVKLGTGGLLRAYTKSVTMALDKCILKEIMKGFHITIEFTYDKTKLIDNLLKNCNIINKEFNDNVVYNINIEEREYFKIKENLNLNTINLIEKETILITY